MKNTFKLNALLKLRKNKEKVLQRELGVYYHTKQCLVKEQDELIIAKEDIDRKVSSFTGKVLDVYDLKRLYKHSEHISLEQQQLNGRLVEIDVRISDKKSQLTHAVKDKKILENLEKRHYEQWLLQQKTIEQKVLDELVSYRYSTSEKEE